MMTLNYFTIVFGGVFFILAWMVMHVKTNKYIIERNQKKWHFWQGVERGFWIFLTCTLIWVRPDFSFREDWMMWAFIIVQAGFYLILFWNVFDPTLNKVRQLAWNHTGNNIMDKLKWYFRVVSLCLTFILLIVGYFFIQF